MPNISARRVAVSPFDKLLDKRQAWLQMDNSPPAIAWAKTPIGILVIHATFAAILALSTDVSLKRLALIGAALAGCVVWPDRRLLIVSMVGVLYFLARPLKGDLITEYFLQLWRHPDVAGGFADQTILFLAAGCFLVMTYCAIALCGRYRDRAPASRPVLSLMISFAAFNSLALLAPEASLLHAVSWTLSAFTASVFFFVAYLVAEQKAKYGLDTHTQIGFIRPFWDGGFLPVKGPGFLQKFAAKGPDDLARVRLKAMKLIVWGAILFAVSELMDELYRDQLGMPTLDAAIVRSSVGDSPPILLAWAVVIYNFLHHVILFGAAQHSLVAIIRMAGFDVPRGMARPLTSRSITEFWGRYLFYFKELLADFFFYPTFARCFKKSPAIRIAFAIFMAAFVGNILFDAIISMPGMAVEGVWPIVYDFQSYVVYAAVLTIGLILSQKFEKPTSPADGWFRHQFFPRARVMAFFALLLIFDSSTDDISLDQRFTFLTTLFGI